MLYAKKVHLLLDRCAATSCSRPLPAWGDAVKIFEGPTLEKIDDRFDYGETRVYAIAVTNGLEITVTYIDISETERRIISAWRSERHGRKAYWGSLG